MDTKRVIIAVVLSMAVLFGWNLLFPPPQKAPQQTTTQQEAPKDSGASITAETTVLGDGAKQKDAPIKPTTGRLITVNTPLYSAVFDTNGGVISEFRLHKYKQTIKTGAPDVDLIGPKAAANRPMRLVLGGKAVWQDNNDKNLELSAGQEDKLTFTGEFNGIRITRTLFFSGDSYIINEKTMVKNNTANRLKGNISYTLDCAPLTSEDDQYNQTRVATYSSSGLDEETDTEDLATEGFTKASSLKWGGVQSNYFLLAMLPTPVENAAEGQEQPVFRADFANGVYNMFLDTPLSGIEPQQEKVLTCDYFLGPKEESVLEGAPNDLAKSVDLGWFDFIAKPLLFALAFLNDYVNNYGVAIILLTIFIKLVMAPLSHKSYKSMEQMKKLQPMLTKIREKHKDDRQKMNEEMMNLYKTYKVNPAGGCLPMLLQIPVFLGLYQALLNSIELRHAPFITHVPFTDIVWLADLSAKDPFYVTPVIMGATMFLQQKMTPSPGDPTQAKIMLFMPVFFTFLFLNFPSGLVVYWLVNNVLSIGQQWWMLRKA